MGDFIAELIRFTEPLVAGAFAILLAFAAWAIQQRSPVEALSKVLRQLQRHAWVCTLITLVVSSILGTAAEEASYLLWNSVGLHDCIIDESFADTTGALLPTMQCPALGEFSMRDVSAVLNGLIIDANASTAGNVVQTRASFSNHLLSSVTFWITITLVYFSCWGLQRKYFSSRESLEHFWKFFSALLLSLLLVVGGLWQSEQAYHRNMRYSAVRTLLRAPELCACFAKSAKDGASKACFDAKLKLRKSPPTGKSGPKP